MTPCHTRSRSVALIAATAVLAAPRPRRLQHPGDPSRTPGVTDDTVTIGTHTPLTGPAAAGYSSISAATTAYFDYVNDNGGINGRTHRVHRQGRRLQPRQHPDRRARARAGGRGLRDPQRPRHAHAHRGARLPQPERGARPVRRVGQPELEPAREVPVHVRRSTPTTSSRARRSRQYAQETYPDKTVCVLGQDDDFGNEFITGAEQVLGADGLATTQTLLGVEPGRHRADRRDEGGRLRDQLARDRQRLHGARARHRRQDEVRRAVVVVVVGRRLPDARRLPRRGRRTEAAAGLRQPELPAVSPDDRVGHAVPARSTTSTTTAPRSTATPSTA